MEQAILLHTEFVERLKRAWMTRDPRVLEGMLAEDIVTVLRSEGRHLTSKQATIHWLGNLWVVQQDPWTEWDVVSDNETTCRVVGRAGYTNGAYATGVTFAGTVTVQFRNGLVVLVDVDVAAALDRAAEAI
jgi:hypothetical protein